MALVEIICDRDQNDLSILKVQYERTYGVELSDAIKKKFSGRKLERRTSPFKITRAYIFNLHHQSSYPLWSSHDPPIPKSSKRKRLQGTLKFCGRRPAASLTTKA